MEPLLTADEAARLLGVPKRRVYHLAEDRDPARRLPAVRIGRTLRFRAQDLEAYINERAS